MPTSSTPIAVLPDGSLGAPVTPGLRAAAGQPWTVSVGNYSNVLLTVTSPGYSGQVLPAFSAQLFTAIAGPINFNLVGALSPTAKPTTGTGYVVLTWWVGPEVKTATIPSPLAATSISISTAVFTGTVTVTRITSVGKITETVTAKITEIDYYRPTGPAGVLSVGIACAGTGTPVQLPTFPLKVFISVAWTPTNTGKKIFVAAGSTVSTDSACISPLVPVVTFQVANADNLWILGTNDDVVRVVGE